VAELALCHHQVVLLMMRSPHHDSDEAKSLELGHLLGVDAGDDEVDAVR
jgi:hypothetical protein